LIWLYRLYRLTGYRTADTIECQNAGREADDFAKRDGRDCLPGHARIGSTVLSLHIEKGKKTSVTLVEKTTSKFECEFLKIGTVQYTKSYALILNLD
jgi:hypothetical protein